LSPVHYYVYYKSDPSRIAELRATVEKLFESVQAATGVRGEWQRRRDDPATFMETFRNVEDAGAFDRALAAAAEDSGFSRLGISRVTEIFRCA